MISDFYLVMNTLIELTDKVNSNSCLTSDQKQQVNAQIDEANKLTHMALQVFTAAQRTRN